MFAPTSFLPILSMNAHSESKRAFLLLLGLAECVAPTQEWPLAQCLFPTDTQPWDDSKRQNGIGDLRKIHSEFELGSSSKDSGPEPAVRGHMQREKRAGIQLGQI